MVQWHRQAIRYSTCAERELAARHCGGQRIVQQVTARTARMGRSSGALRPREGRGRYRGCFSGWRYRYQHQQAAKSPRKSTPLAPAASTIHRLYLSISHRKEKKKKIDPRFFFGLHSRQITSRAWLWHVPIGKHVNTRLYRQGSAIDALEKDLYYVV